VKEAMLYQELSDKRVRCDLCSHRCVIADSKRGICGVRENKDGTLYSLVYGKIVATHVDPIEKKPLFNFHPGTRAFSVATVGCNFKCAHCQNAEISQMPAEHNRIIGQEISPEKIVKAAEKNDCKSIAYTYTEPTIFMEYAYDTAMLASKRGIKNVFVTNGYMTEKALRTIHPYLDAANVDLKGFTEEHYQKICAARLKPVLDTLKLMKELDIWVEVTTLIIPTINDSDEVLRNIAEFILSLGVETPWHVSRFHPTYKMLDLPPTSVQSVIRARQIGLEVGLRYVYSGNIPGDEGEHTYCYNCGKVLIPRYGYQLEEIRIEDSRCKYCGAAIDGVYAKKPGRSEGRL